VVETVEVQGFRAATSQDLAPAPTTDEPTEPAVTFDQDVYPILVRMSCTVQVCHSTQFPKGNLDLSETSVAYTNIVIDKAAKPTTQSGDYRVNRAQPEQSLILTATLSGSTSGHAAVQSWQVDDADYKTILQWLSTGLSRF